MRIFLVVDRGTKAGNSCQIMQHDKSLYLCMFVCMYQSLYLWMSLSYARDEFHWLLRHAENIPQKKSSATKAEDFVDRFSPALISVLMSLLLLPTTVYLISRHNVKSPAQNARL